MRRTGNTEREREATQAKGHLGCLHVCLMNTLMVCSVSPSATTYGSSQPPFPGRRASRGVVEMSRRMNRMASNLVTTLLMANNIIALETCVCVCRYIGLVRCSAFDWKANDTLAVMNNLWWVHVMPKRNFLKGWIGVRHLHINSWNLKLIGLNYTLM